MHPMARQLDRHLECIGGRFPGGVSDECRRGEHVSGTDRTVGIHRSRSIVRPLEVPAERGRILRQHGSAADHQCPVAAERAKHQPVEAGQQAELVDANGIRRR